MNEQPLVSDDYIRSLKPEMLRYDMTLEEDFVISVLPNGIKTWVFQYEDEGRERRKTLGVFPEMSYEQAMIALRNERSQIVHLGGKMNTAIESNSIANITSPEVMAKNPKSVSVLHASDYLDQSGSAKDRGKVFSGWSKYLLWLVIITFVLVGSYLAFIWIGLDSLNKQTLFGMFTPKILSDKPFRAESTASPATVRTVLVSAPLEGANVTAVNTFSYSKQKSSPESSDDEFTVSSSVAVAGRQEVSMVQFQTRLQASDPVRGSSVPSQVDGVIANKPSLIFTKASYDDVISTAEVEAEPVRNNEAQAFADPGLANDVSETSLTEPPPSTPESAVAALQAVKAIEPANSQVKPPAEATAMGGIITRAMITSGVKDHEPVDDLGDHVALMGSAIQSVFFFTEMRNFSDGVVIHRWEHKGKIIADVPLRVAHSWGWRTYSSKDLLPSMTGEWSVSVIDARGQILASRTFRVDR